MHLAPGRGPLREHAAGADLGVVGMGEDAQDRTCPRSGFVPAHAARSSTNRTSARTGTPVAPFGPRSLPFSEYAGPAMSRCTHGTSPTNSARNHAAVIAPPQRSPMFLMSAMFESIRRRYSLCSGSGQIQSPVARPAFDDLVDERVVVAHRAGDVGPERDHARAGERRRVHDARRLLLREQGEGVGEDQPPLRVGVQHLRRLARRSDVITSPGFCAAPPGMFSADGIAAIDVDLRLQPGDRLHRREDRRGAAHVDLHRLHALGVLDRQTARVERDTLAGERDRGGASGALVGQLDQPRRVHAALPDAEDAAEPALLQLRLRPDLAREAFGLRHLLRLARELGRRQVPRRRVDEVTRPCDGVHDHLGAYAPPRVRPSRRASAFPTTVTFDSGACSFVGLVPIEAVAAEPQPLGGRLRPARRFRP